MAYHNFLILLPLLLTYRLCQAGKPIIDEKQFNIIDGCWRSKPGWENNRQALADCAVGYGKDAMGGKGGKQYAVTDPSDDPSYPKPGTLRYGAIQSEPLWIIFRFDMVLKLENELMVNSYKTIDGRGSKINISNGPCISIHGVTHVIVHGINLQDCKPSRPGLVKSASDHNAGRRGGSDGDGIMISGSSHVWIDHCYLARCTDGLLDVIHGSTAVTISNNYFTEHDKVMLLGHADTETGDKIMKVTVVFNHFGPGLGQRMPRVRYGYAHVANNKYDKWKEYAIGGSADPTILSECNYFSAPDDPKAKRVTSREANGNVWKNWKWRSKNDEFVNGAFFDQSGILIGSTDPSYTRSQYFAAAHGNEVPRLTSDAGVLLCVPNKPC